MTKALFEDPELAAVDLERLREDVRRRGDASARRPVRGTHLPFEVNNDTFAFWRFRDLVERRIVSDRTDLFRKQQRGFPRAMKLSKGLGAVALFPVASVKTWVRENLGSANPDERLCDRPRKHPIDEDSATTGAGN